MVPAIERRASEPDFSVQYGYLGLWFQALRQLAVPESFSLLAERPSGADALAKRQRESTDIRAAVLGVLRKVVSEKTRVAHEMTADTIRMMQRER
jgi:hypothetical protein